MDPVLSNLRDRDFDAESLREALNREVAPTVRELRERWNDFVQGAFQGYAEVTGNQSTASITFVDLPTALATFELTLARRVYILVLGAVGTSMAANVAIGVSIDGVAPTAQATTKARSDTLASLSLLTSAELDAGTHTVQLQWATSAGTVATGPTSSAATGMAVAVL